ncbi:MAG: tetratricopeptide repeat protein [Magnetococcales bacterium]|nr:tetratricopeptide repeat protein [Magnetococcales bacterium]
MKEDESMSAAQRHYQEELIRATQCHKAEAYDQAKEIYLQLLEQQPNNSLLLYLLGLVAHKQEDYAKALNLISRAILQEPQNTTYLNSLGNTLLAREQVDAAMARYKDVLKINPEHIEAMSNLGMAYLIKKEYSQAAVTYQQALKIRFNWDVLHLGLTNSFAGLECPASAGVHQQLYHHYNNSQPENPRPLSDTFFVDSQVARREALKQNRIELTTAVDGLQVCYHPGEALADDPANLVSIPFDDMYPVLLNTRLRIPKEVAFDLENASAISQAIRIAWQLDGIEVTRKRKVQVLANESICNRPEFKPDEPLRIYFRASRLTTVMQFSSKNLAKAFEKLGCQTHVVLEKNDMEALDAVQALKAQIEFNPHITVSINHLNNQMLHEDVFNVIWWQDPMPEIYNREPLPWRERDIVFSSYPQFDDMLKDCQAPEIHRQSFCVDLDHFRLTQPLEGRKKIVFVGSGYEAPHTYIGIERAIHDKLEENGEVTDEFLKSEAERFDLSFEAVRLWHFSKVLRTTTVVWWCQVGSELGYEVEVYGWSWQKTPEILPFYKGELSHGPEVAKVYNEARYALCANPRLVNSQRLVEVAACGAIPVVYDARAYTEPPNWDDECLFFNTRKELKKCLTRIPEGNPLDIPPHHSFDLFAERILAMVSKINDG